jgi:hypothetical protein
MNAYNQLASLTLALAGLVLLLWLSFSRRLWLTLSGTSIALGLIVLYAVMPVTLFGIAYLDVRLLPWAALILPPFVVAPPGGWRVAAGTLLVVIAAANGAVALKTWHDRQPDYVEIRKSFALVPPGSTILIAMQDGLPLSDQSLLYAPTLAVPEAKAFVWSFYGSPSGFPIETKSPYDRLVVSSPIQYVPPTMVALQHRRSLPPQLQTWSRDFQYLYVIGRQTGEAAVAHAVPIFVGRRFTLYRINPD